MKNIVHIKDHDLKVSIQDMANFSKNEYKSVKRLIQSKKEYFLELGLSLPKEYDFKSLELNEPQATFLMTLFKNNEVVTRFKLELVKQFYAMREKLCDATKYQIEQKDNRIKELTVNKMRTYKDGFMSLRKYLRENNIVMSEEKAWERLFAEGKIETQDVLTARRILVDHTFGRQEGHGVIEFNSRALDCIFGDFVKSEATLF